MLPQIEPTAKAHPPQLLVDAMLGRLARWLRLMGYDAEYWREGDDDALIRYAASQGRLIVTRDHALAGRRGVHALLVAAEDLDAQIREVRPQLQPAPEPFTRCPECNGSLVELPHSEAVDLVPAYVWHTQREFKRCERCGRAFWRGTHWPGMSARLEQDAGDPGSDVTPPEQK